MSTYRVMFERIGSNHHVAPVFATVRSADHLASCIHKHARPHLMSQDYTVHVDLEKSSGFIVCGMHSGGNFTIEKQE